MLALKLHEETRKIRQRSIVAQLQTIPFSTEVTEILRRENDNPKHVRVVGLAVDFYLSLYLKDVITKRADGVEGFDPSTRKTCFIFKESSLTNYSALLNSVVNERLAWVESFLFTYLCAACAGELRHSPGRINELPKHEIDRLNSFHITTNGKPVSRSETQRQFLKETPKEKIPDFLTMATQIFNQYSWAGSFGGKKWGDISKTGADRLANKLDRIAFIDRVFDLKHNGGPIFDKNGAVHNDSLQQFLDCKLEMTKDNEWNEWLRFASKPLIACLVLANKTSLWKGKQDLEKIKLVASLFAQNDNGSDHDVEVAMPPPPKPKPSKPLEYPLPADTTCPKGVHK